VSVAHAVPLEIRARQSRGASHHAIYRMVAAAFAARGIVGAQVVDVGCGRGALYDFIRDRAATYRGLDAVLYREFPEDAQFAMADLDSGAWPVTPSSADVVTAVEVIEHLENPWAFMRQLAAIARPGGWVLVTTPNQQTLLSLATLLTKRRFSSFQDAHYPAHRTALLEVDLWRSAAAAGLTPVSIEYSLHGRLPLSAAHYPAAIARLSPRRLSDNLMLVARKADRP
jgi:2-polyprenyl-3-methyl-5-hydroxy-6-metoxy-1,4-benzoquinol methylase